MKLNTIYLKHAPDLGDGNSQGGSSPSSDQQKVQGIVAARPAGPECRRDLATANYAANTNVVVDIPRDTSIKRIQLNLIGSFTVTFASGSPTLSPFGVFARVCPNFNVVADGSRAVKTLDLFMQRCMNAIAYGGFPRRAYRAAASLTASVNLASTEWMSGAIAYPSTTQDIVSNESVIVDFENPLAWRNGKSISQLYTRNLATCNMTFGFANITNIQTTGVGATVTYSNVTLAVVPSIIEDREAGLAEGAFDFNEMVIRKSYSSQQSQAQIDLNTGNKLVGVAVMSQDGDTNQSLSDAIITQMQLLRNGVESIQNSNFRSLASDNKARYGVSDDQLASSLRGLSGFAFMNLIKNGDALSGLDTRLLAGTSQVQLQVSTASSTGVQPATYTAGVTISVLQQQLIPVPSKS